MTEMVGRLVSDHEWVWDAFRLFERLGFVHHKDVWLKRGDLFVCVDAPEQPVNQRFVGMYRMRLNEAGAEMMHAVALVPWYGDGEPRIEAFKLVVALLNQAIYGDA